MKSRQSLAASTSSAKAEAKTTSPFLIARPRPGPFPSAESLSSSPKTLSSSHCHLPSTRRSCPVLVYLECSLGGIGLHCQSNCSVEHAIHHMGRLALQT